MAKLTESRPGQKTLTKDPEDDEKNRGGTEESWFDCLLSHFPTTVFLFGFVVVCLFRAPRRG